MLPSVLGSSRAIAINIETLRTFVRVRALATTHQDLANRLSELGEPNERLAMQHDTFSRNTRVQLRQVFDGLLELMTPPEPPKPPIGFVAPKERSPQRQKAVRLRPLDLDRAAARWLEFSFDL